MKLAKKTFFSVLVAVATLMAASNAFGQIDDECTEEVLLSYYPEKFVAITLERFQIPQSQWSSIQNELKQKDQEVVPRVEEKAAKLTPNPLRDSQNRQQAIKIFRETLYELFADVMQAHGINDQEQIQAMLNDIQQQKARQFAQCVEKYHRPEKNSRQQPLERQTPSTPQQQPQTQQQQPQQQQYQQQPQQQQYQQHPQQQQYQQHPQQQQYQQHPQQQQYQQQPESMQESWNGRHQTYQPYGGSEYYYPSYPAYQPYH